MSLLKTYTEEEKAALKKHGLPNDQHSMSSDHFVLGMRFKESMIKEINKEKKDKK